MALPPHSRRHRRQFHTNARARRKAPPFVVRRRPSASTPAAAVAAGPIATIITVVGVLFAVCGIIVIAGFAAVAGAYAYFTSDLPKFDPSALPQFQTSRIYDRYGNIIEDISDPQSGNRYQVSLNQISPYLINATVAAEDKTFWTNKGIDVAAIGRAVRNTFVDSSYGSSGASTITMQVVKQAFPDRYTAPTKEDKVRQVFLAYGVAQKYSKEEVLTFYLNQIPYGNRSYGIQAAAHNYFNTDAKNLELWQASILAGLPQAPSAYDPTVNLDAARHRQLYVLTQMVDQGYITEAQKNDAYARSADASKYLKFRDDRPSGAPHFVNYVRQYVESRYGTDALYRGGLNIYTTIDMDIQSLAEDVVRNGVAKESKAGYDVSNGALVAVVPWSGQILCMVGSTDFNDKANNGEFNVAVNPRQPGSSIKPIAYGMAMEKGWYPSYVILDYHKTWDDGTAKGYTPNNFNQLHNGAVTVRDALQQSLNIPALKAMEFDFTKDGSRYGQHDGIQNFVDFAHAMGLTESFNRPTSDYGLGISLALGGGEVTPLQLTNAYATFANQGKYVAATPIVRILKSDGTPFKDPKTGKDVDNSLTVPQGQQVMDPGNAYLMTSVLTDNKARTPIFGASSPLILRDRPVAAKTGTTNDFRDGWTIGYTTEVAVGVWVGNNDNHPMRNVDGVENAGPIWNEFMQLIHAHEKAPRLLAGPDGSLPGKEFIRPPSVIDGQSCAATGHKATPTGANIKDLFVKGKEPTLACGELNAREQSELLQAYADLTHNASLLPQTNPDGSPAIKKTEFGHYTGAGASRLNAYLNAVDTKYRPKGVRAYNPNPQPSETPVATLPSGTAPPGKPRITQAPTPVGQPTVGIPAQPSVPPVQPPRPAQSPPAKKLPTPILVPGRKP
ncbi:MAG: transglycosylase domain-containing protein [Thermomicrobiales bacterium]